MSRRRRRQALEADIWNNPNCLQVASAFRFRNLSMMMVCYCFRIPEDYKSFVERF
jgi:hypothetical protein